jgi:hypothetical protein
MGGDVVMQRIRMISSIIAVVLLVSVAEAQSPISTPNYINPTTYKGREGIDWAQEIVILRNNKAANITAKNFTQGTQNGNAATVTILINGTRVNTYRDESANAAVSTYIQGDGVYRVIAVCVAEKADPKECTVSVNVPPSKIIE